MLFFFSLFVKSFFSSILSPNSSSYSIFLPPPSSNHYNVQKIRPPHLITLTRSVSYVIFFFFSFFLSLEASHPLSLSLSSSLSHSLTHHRTHYISISSSHEHGESYFHLVNKNIQDTEYSRQQNIVYIYIYRYLPFFRPEYTNLL